MWNNVIKSTRKQYAIFSIYITNKRNKNMAR